MEDLSKILTCDLVAELEKRQGVQLERVEPYKPYAIDLGDHGHSGTGPVVIVIVTD